MGKRGVSRLGYGSHSFLSDYIRRKKFGKIMEIGVAHGENAKTMVMVASQNLPREGVEYYGFDTFGGDDDFHMKHARQKLEKTAASSGSSKETLLRPFPRS